MTCLVCGAAFIPNHRGRPRVYCTTACRRAVEAARATAETLPQWLPTFEAFAEEAKGRPWYAARRQRFEQIAARAAEAVELAARADAATRRLP